MSPVRPRERLGRIQQRHAAAGNDAFLNRRLGRVERVVDAILLLLHFDFRRAADADDRNAAGELRQTFLQLLLVVVRVVSSICGLIWPTRAWMSAFLPAPSMIVVSSFVDADLLGGAQHVQLHVLELDAEVFADDLAAGDDGDVFEHRLAAIAEARRLHGRNLEAAAQLVDDERRQRFAFDFFGDDEQRTSRLHHRFQDRQHRLQAGELLLVDEDVAARRARPPSCRHW